MPRKRAKGGDGGGLKKLTLLVVVVVVVVVVAVTLYNGRVTRLGIPGWLEVLFDQQKAGTEVKPEVEVYGPFREAYELVRARIGEPRFPHREAGRTHQTFLENAHMMLWSVKENRVYVVNGTTNKWHREYKKAPRVDEMANQDFVNQLACRELECPPEGLHAPTGGLYVVWKEWGLKETHGWALRNCMYMDSVYEQFFDKGKLMGLLRAAHNDESDPVILALIQESEDAGISLSPRLPRGTVPTCEQSQFLGGQDLPSGPE